MKKIKMLVSMYCLQNGGGEKALVNMFHSLDPERYDIDLQMFVDRGVNIQFLPSWIHRLPPLFPEGAPTAKQQILALLKLGKIGAVFEKIKNGIFRGFQHDRQQKINAWKTLKPLCPVNDTEYDVVVAGMHGIATYYALDCIKAKRKVAWMHTDYSKKPPLKEDFFYYRKVDAVVTVSQHCRDALQTAFPELNNIIVLENINCPGMIEQMAAQISPAECFPDDAEYHFVSVGRLIPLKGFDMAVEAAQIMKKAGIRFKWYVIGPGEEEQHLVSLSKELDVSDVICFPGLKANPYPYIKNADVVVQTSRYEGKSMVLDEAKILHKPIVSTAYDSVKDQIKDGENGIIVPIDAPGIADGIMRVLRDEALRNHILEQLQNEDFSQKALIERYDSTFGMENG